MRSFISSPTSKAIYALAQSSTTGGTSSSLLLSTSITFSVRWSSSSSSSSDDNTKGDKASASGFDADAFAKEQQRRRTTAPRKAFWKQGAVDTTATSTSSKPAPGGTGSVDGTSSASSASVSSSRALYGRDTVELIERVHNVEREGVARDEKLRLVKRREAEQKKQAAAAAAAVSPKQPSSPAEARLASLYNTYTSTAKKAALGGRTGPTTSAGAASASTSKDGGEILDDEAIKKKEELAERRERLRFRELDNELDRVRVSRDLFQWVNYLRKGESYAIDTELERELRYYPEHVASELKMNVKFLTGGSQLARSGSAFPTLTELTKMASAAKREFDGDRVTESSFKVPTVVFMSQFTHAAVEAKDIVPVYAQLLREALLGTGVYSPASLPKAPSKKNKATKSSSIKAAEGENTAAASKSTTTTTAGLLDKIDDSLSEVKALQLVEDILNTNPTNSATPAVNVMFFKTVDFDSGLWTKKWLSRVHGSRMMPALADRTFVGSHLVRKFAPIGLRNFGAHYIFLVDHNGKIRWLSTAMPTEDEAKWFLDHIRSLVRAYIAARARG